MTDTAEERAEVNVKGMQRIAELRDSTQSQTVLPARREVLRALLAAAGLPAVSPAANPARKVGIIGGGMAGVCVAWLLDGERDVVLLESAKSIGGNIRSATVELDGQRFSVDMGAQYFHPGPYPLYTRLLSILGLYPSSAFTHGFPASITVHADSQTTPRFVSPVLPERFWPLIAPWNWEALHAFSVAFAAAKIREQQQGDWGLTMEDWLLTLGLNSVQREQMLLPWVASLYSGSIDDARQLSARAAMIFAAKALPDNPLDPLLYYVLNPGLAEAPRRMLQQTSTVRVLTDSAVTRVLHHQQQDRFELQCANGRVVKVDEVIFAAPPEPTRKLLQSLPGTLAQQIALDGISMHDARLLLHTDPAYAPADPDHWSFLNCSVSGKYCESSMWLAKVLAVPAMQTSAKLWKSWASHRSRDPKQILHEVRFRHMLPTPNTLRAQAVLARLQGVAGIWFAGGYTHPYDSQETALCSAIRVVWGLQVASARGRTLGSLAASDLAD